MGLAPVRSRRPTLGGYARNWSNGGYMWLKEREAVAAVGGNAAHGGGRRRSPEGGTAVLGEGYSGMVVGFKGKAGAGRQ
jgi:hypothetical protein